MGSFAALTSDVSDRELRWAKFQLLFRLAEKMSVSGLLSC